MEAWHRDTYGQAKWAPSERWHSSTTLKKNYQNKKGCKLKRKHRKYCFHKDLIALALALWAESNAFLPQPQHRKDAGAFGVERQGTAVQVQMMYFQTMISKIQD